MDRRLPRDYTTRSENAHFLDLPTGTVHQHQVYAFLRYLVERGNFSRVIDIGCGSGEKLKGLPALTEVICIDTADMQPLVTQNLPNAQFIQCDLEIGIPQLKFELTGTVIVCSDVIEHLREPEILIRQLAEFAEVCPYVLISTPERVRARGLLDMGPPGNPAHTMEWTADELSRFLEDCGLPPGFLLGYTYNNDQDWAKNTLLVVAGREATFQRPTATLCVAAMLNVYNERDIIEPVARYLRNQQIQVHVIDNWSNDGTSEILARLHEEGVCHNVLRFPEQDTQEYNWRALLEHTAQYASRLDCDWAIHYDADEFRSGPWPNATLAEAITLVDHLGYSAVDFTLLNFVFTDDESPAAFSPERFKFFDFGRHPAHLQQVKAWKNTGQIVDLASSGGHIANFSGMRVFPLKFLTKHYPLRSVTHASTKIHRDRLPRIEREHRELGWHSHYDTYCTMPSLQPWRKYEAINFDPIVFSAEFLVERLSGVGIETEPRAVPNSGTLFHYIDAQIDDNKRLQSRIGDLEAENARLHAASDCLEQQVAALQSQLTDLTQSKIWRFTARLLRFPIAPGSPKP